MTAYLQFKGFFGLKAIELILVYGAPTANLDRSIKLFILSQHHAVHAPDAKIVDGVADLGIIICGTGQGIMMAANKVLGIRCGVCRDTFSAAMIRAHNDANMLALGARVLGEGLELEIVDAFLATEFEGGRHASRVAMIELQG
jgi:ribose 5-phosphate isomerase B